MEENNKQVVEMTTEEKAQFEAFKATKATQEAKNKAKRDRDAYRDLVDETIERVVPSLLCLSDGIKDTKRFVMDEFKAAIDMKTDILRLRKDDQRSDTFTNTNGNKRIVLGFCVVDGYRDTVEDGIAIVREYIEGMASDVKTKALVKMVLRLLARDAKGTLKASRVVQLRKIAEESESDRFMEGKGKDRGEIASIGKIKKHECSSKKYRREYLR